MTREALSERDQERVLKLSRQLAEARSDDELATAALESIQRLIGAEGGSFLRVDLKGERVSGKTCFMGSWLSPEVISSWGKWASAVNPIYAESLGRRSTPFVIPVTELSSDEFYEVGYKPWGVRYQAIVPIEINRESLTGVAYTLARCSKDFSSQEISGMYALQAVLTAHHAALKVRHRSEMRIDAVPNMARLTQREQQVLSLVASGMTAVAIGHSLGISPGTVRKHVENTYSKLDIHDRLQAVSYCRQAGLL